MLYKSLYSIRLDVLQLPENRGYKPYSAINTPFASMWHLCICNVMCSWVLSIAKRIFWKHCPVLNTLFVVYENNCYVTFQRYYSIVKTPYERRISGVYAIVLIWQHRQSALLNMSNSLTRLRLGIFAIKYWKTSQPNIYRWLRGAVWYQSCI